MRQLLALVAAVGLLLSACAPSSDDPATTSPGQADTTTTSGPATTEGETTTTAPEVTTTTAADQTTTTTAPGTTSTLPGEPIDFGPLAGDRLIVVGVAHDDVLNLRAGPGVGQEILAELAPTADDVVARGATRQLDRSLWIEVRADGTTGWVSLAFVGYEGITDDATAATIDRLGGRVTAVSMRELGTLAAIAWASQDPASDVVEVVEASVGDLGEVTFDVIGLGDDSVLGFRLHVFGEPVDGGFSLRTVERTTICGRGVDADGLCT